MASKLSTMICSKLLVDGLLVPEEALAVLHPLEVGNRHAAGVGQDIGNHEDILFRQNLVGQRSGGAVGAFAENLAAQPVGIVRK